MSRNRCPQTWGTDPQPTAQDGAVDVYGKKIDQMLLAVATNWLGQKRTQREANQRLSGHRHVCVMSCTAGRHACCCMIHRATDAHTTTDQQACRHQPGQRWAATTMHTHMLAGGLQTRTKQLQYSVSTGKHMIHADHWGFRGEGIACCCEKTTPELLLFHWRMRGTHDTLSRTPLKTHTPENAHTTHSRHPFARRHPLHHMMKYVGYDATETKPHTIPHCMGRPFSQSHAGVGQCTTRDSGHHSTRKAQYSTHHTFTHPWHHGKTADDAACQVSHAEGHCPPTMGWGLSSHTQQQQETPAAAQHAYAALCAQAVAPEAQHARQVYTPKDGMGFLLAP